MSASKEELGYSLRCNVKAMVETMAEIMLNGHMTKQEIADYVDKLINEFGCDL